jgi:DNA polymerase III subunit gamma/tau
MATQALYRKWRSKTFEEVIGQEHVVHTLQNAIAHDRIVHAYLFTGPRGTGKTTTARLLAKAVNCQGDTGVKPCGECHICRAIDEGRLMDMIEIDAASNRGIDEIRDLRDRVGFRPAEAEKKFYIIDEVHMLTDPAFNALLKTLEEPPDHVVFVMATTEPHKIPATIVSRCQRFDFRRIPIADTVGRLNQIAAAEGLQIEDTAVEYIARQASGSLRDAISLLDQLTAFGSDTITLSQIRGILGTVASQQVADFVDRVTDRDITGGLALINQVISEGTEPRQFMREVVEHLRQMLLLKMGDGPSMLRATASENEIAVMESQVKKLTARRLLHTIRLFNAAAQEAKWGFLPQLPLELAFIEACEEEEAAATPPSQVAPTPQPRAARPEPAPPQPIPAPAEQAKAEKAAPAPSPKPAPAQEERAPAASAPTSGTEGTPLTFDQVHRQWANVLEDLRHIAPLARGLLNSVNLVGIEDGAIIVEAPSDHIQGRIERPSMKGPIEAGFARVLGRPARLRVVLQGQYHRPQAGSAASAPNKPSTAASSTAADNPSVSKAAAPRAEEKETDGAAADTPQAAKTFDMQSDEPTFAYEPNEAPSADASSSPFDPMIEEGLKLGGVISDPDS